jgi:O-antigen ligase
MGRNYVAHNQYLAYLLKSGLMGLAALLSILFFWLNDSVSKYKRYRKPELFFAFALLASLMALGVSGHPFDYTTMYWYVVIMVSVINAPDHVFSSYTR